MSDTALQHQIDFLLEIDALKSVMRQSQLADGSRRENSAEHSWHLAMFALVLAEAAPEADIRRVVEMLLIHDLVEIDAGDAPIHGGHNSAEQAFTERMAADRIFGLLPAKQRDEFMSLWVEFETGATPEARFAKALDRLQPLLLNVQVGGGTWSESGVTEEQVYARYGPTIEKGSTALWGHARKLVRQHFQASEPEAGSFGGPA